MEREYLWGIAWIIITMIPYGIIALASVISNTDMSGVPVIMSNMLSSFVSLMTYDLFIVSGLTSFDTIYKCMVVFTLVLFAVYLFRRILSTILINKSVRR